MKKANADSKVKKTFVRHSEQKVKNNPKVVRDLNSGSSKSTAVHPIISQELDQPTLCSSEALANYLLEAKNAVPQRNSCDVLNFDKVELNSKVTKKLNFHFNDRIYNNLVELNADVATLKNKKDRKNKVNTTKKDLEPKIEDFCKDEKEEDLVPNIPIIRPKLKPVKIVETGKLHKLVASYEVL